MGTDINKKWIFQAGTVEEAIEKAVLKLGCTRDEICVKVVSEEKRGLFGMEGAAPAKIAVTLKNNKE
jgi:spoIIIJ-associated protein